MNFKQQGYHKKMSVRSNNTMQNKAERKRFSYRQISRRSLEVPYHISSSSSQNLTQKTHNFNSGHNLKPIEVSSNTQSDSSQYNQTENFIRAQFKPLPLTNNQDFKLFYQQKNQFKSQNQKNNSFTNNKIGNNKKRETYNTAYFQISIQDQTQKDIQKTNCKNKNEEFKLFLKKESKNEENLLEKDNQPEIHIFSQIENLQKTIMKTLKQKQKHVELLQSQVLNLQEQKLHNFKINKQLQIQLEQIREKNRVDYLFNKNWKPKTTVQMKLFMDYQQLSDELKDLQNQQSLLKELQGRLKQQEKLLKQSLKSTLKTRKEYAKNIVKQDVQNLKVRNKSHFNPKYNQIEKHHQLHQSKANKKHKINSKKQNINMTNMSPSQLSHEKKISKTDLNQFQEKQLLLKLLNDFNELKAKVDQSLIIKSKLQSSNSKNQLIDQKSRRKRNISLKR